MNPPTSVGDVPSRSAAQTHGPGPDAVAVPPLLLRQVSGGSAVSSALALLFDGKAQTVAPTHAPRLFTLADVASGSDEPPAGVALTIVVGPRTMQLLCFAVRAGLPEAAIATRLMTGVSDWMRAAGYERLVAAASCQDADSMSQLREAGFTERPGGRADDLAWLELYL
jgi:hypothetical protein